MNFNKRINIEDSLMDLTPIVDVVFNLLIFFALSLNFSQVVSSINIKLPKAKSSEVVTEKQVVVSIERNNKVYINDQALYLDQIPNYLDKINKPQSINFPLQKKQFLGQFEEYLKPFFSISFFNFPLLLFKLLNISCRQIISNLSNLMFSYRKTKVKGFVFDISNSISQNACGS